MAEEETRDAHRTEDLQALHLQLQALADDHHALAQANAGLIRETRRLEDVARQSEAQRLQAHERWLVDQEQRAQEERTQLRTRMEEAERENHRLKAEAQALWDERHAQMVDRTRRLQRELDIAQAVAKLVPATLRQDAPPPRESGVDAGQQEIIGLLRQLVEMVGGEPVPERQSTARQMDDADTMVSFPPEPLWPDAFRASQLTTEDYARELGVEERENG